jgi:methyltransferase
MELSAKLYLVLLAVVAAGRMIELTHSRRNQQRLMNAGSSRIAEPAYKWMVALHTSVLLMAALEVVLSRRPWIPMLGWPMLALFLAANGARWWVIRTLGPRWNVQVMPAALGVITDRGPYRWVRHPNYSAVFIEMLALPLIHTAWLTAMAGAIAHVFVLRRRIALEESVMRSDPQWRAAFEHRARFVPGLL